MELGGVLAQWDKMCEIADPQYAKNFYITLKEYGIWPENLNGFVFLSPSANKGSKEIALARLIDQQISITTPNKKPLFIASDFFGTHNKGHFKPGFDTTRTPGLKNVNFAFISANANRLPIDNTSVDIIMDRMGAIWHSIHELLPSEMDLCPNIPKKVKTECKTRINNIFGHYFLKLKPNGYLVVDAPDDTRVSTATLLNLVFDTNMSQHFKEIGLRCSFVGEGKNRLLVFSRDISK